MKKAALGRRRGGTQRTVAIAFQQHALLMRLATTGWTLVCAPIELLTSSLICINVVENQSDYQTIGGASVFRHVALSDLLNPCWLQ